eukprot:921616-Pelagomonas_calceolata.AAC.2
MPTLLTCVQSKNQCAQAIALAAPIYMAGGGNEWLSQRLDPNSGVASSLIGKAGAKETGGGTSAGATQPKVGMDLDEEADMTVLASNAGELPQTSFGAYV